MVEEARLSAVLSEFARTMVTDFPIQRILDSLVEQIVTVLPITAAGVTLISEGEPPHYVAASDGDALRFERLQTETGEGPCLLAYHSGEAVAVQDMSSETRFPNFRPPAEAAGLAAVFTFPLRHGGHSVLGALDVYRDTVGPMGAHDMEAAQTLADVTAAYLINAESRDEKEKASNRFQHRSLHDPLTGLPNRVLLQERLQHAAERSHRSHSAAAVLFVDLDQFKAVNDNYGHRVGDELLVSVARRLSAMVRPGDTLARVSGDEFVFLCEDLHSKADAELVAARIKDGLDGPFMVGRLALVVTASVGIAFAGPGDEISDDLIADADKAMYAAKHDGGDGHRILEQRQPSGGN